MPGGSFGSGQVGAALEIADVHLPPAVDVLHPREHPPVRRAGELVDVVLGRLDPLARVRGERVEREAGELAPLVRQEVEAGAVRPPGPGQELRVALVRRRLDRVAGRDVDDPDRDVGVRAELDGEELRPVGREAHRERVHPLAEEVARLGLALAPDVHLAVGRRAPVAREREALAVGRPRRRRELVLHLREVRELLRPAALGGDAVELVELVAVTVGVEEDRAVLAHRDAADGVVDERRQLLGPATVELRRPEVELPRDVRDEEHALAVGRELRDRVQAPMGEELLEGRLRHGQSL